MSSANPPDSLAWSTDTGADQLIDEVFDDLDQLLSGKQIPAEPRNPAASESFSQSAFVPLLALPDGTTPPEETLPTDGNPYTAIIVKRGWAFYGERLFFLASCVSLAGVALWIAMSGRLQAQQFLNPTNPAANYAISGNENSTSQAGDFVDYVRESLDAIDRQQVTTQASGVNPLQNMATAASPNLVAGNPGLQVIERVYVPVYPTNVTAKGSAATPIPQVAPMPQIASPSPPPPVAYAPQAIPQSSSTQTIPQPPPPASLSSHTTELPPPPSFNTFNPDVLEPAPAPALASQPQQVYSLVGVLESGDRSAALFDVEGTTQRVGLGEEVGTSEWKLTAVQNQQILIEQNGQTKSLYVGQNFADFP